MFGPQPESIEKAGHLALVRASESETRNAPCRASSLALGMLHASCVLERRDSKTATCALHHAHISGQTTTIIPKQDAPYRQGSSSRVTSFPPPRPPGTISVRSISIGAEMWHICFARAGPFKARCSALFQIKAGQSLCIPLKHTCKGILNPPWAA